MTEGKLNNQFSRRAMQRLPVIVDLSVMCAVVVGSQELGFSDVESASLATLTALAMLANSAAWVLRDHVLSEAEVLA